MMRSSGYNRFGVLMGTSWPASCPRSHRLQGDFSPMITLILLQRAFCATAYKAYLLERWNVISLQCHFNALPKFACVESRVFSRKRQRDAAFYTPINLCARKHVHLSVAVGIFSTGMSSWTLWEPRL